MLESKAAKLEATLVTADQAAAKLTALKPRPKLVDPYLSQALKRRLTKFEKAAFDEAKGRGYLTVKGDRRELINVWYQWCDATEHPYVFVQSRSRTSDIRMDLIVTPWKLPREAVDSIFDYLLLEKRLVKMGSAVGGSHGFYVRCARQFADEIATLLLHTALNCRSAAEAEQI